MLPRGPGPTQALCELVAGMPRFGRDTPPLAQQRLAEPFAAWLGRQASRPAIQPSGLCNAHAIVAELLWEDRMSRPEELIAAT